MLSRDTHEASQSAFAAALNEIVVYATPQNAKNIDLFLHILLLEQTTLASSIAAINTSKIGKQDDLLTEKMTTLATHFFVDRNDEQMELLKEKIKLVEKIKKPVQDNETKCLVEISLQFKEKVDNFLYAMDWDKVESEQVTQGKLAASLAIQAELNALESVKKSDVVRDWFTQSCIRVMHNIAVFYRKLAVAYESKIVKTKDVALNDIQLAQRLAFLDYYKKSYEAWKQVILSGINNPTMQVVASHFFHPESLFVNEIKNSYKVIAQAYTELNAIVKNPASYQNAFYIFKKDHDAFVANMTEHMRNMPVKANTTASSDNQLQLLTKRFDLKVAREAYSKLFESVLQESAVERGEYFLNLMGYGQVASALDIFHPNANDFKKIEPVHIRTLKTFYQALLHDIGALNHSSTLSGAILNLKQVNCIISNLINIIGIEDNHFYVNLPKSKSTTDSALKIELMNKCDFLSILSHFVRICLDCGKTTFDVENLPRTEQFYAAHGIPLTSDLMILFDLLQKEITITNIKLGRKDAQPVVISEKEMAKIETAYHQLIAECEAESKKNKQRYEIAMQKMQEVEEKSNESNTSLNEVSKMDSSSQVLSLSQEGNLYFEASAIEIKAPKTHQAGRTLQLLKAIKKYTEAKEAAKLAHNHRIVVGSIQEIAHCYLQIAICQPYSNLSTAFMMYKDASKHAKEALNYFNLHVQDSIEETTGPRTEDLFKGIHIVMNSIAEAIAQTDKILKREEARLDKHLEQERKCLDSIINKIGLHKWYQGKPWEKRSEQSRLRAANIKLLAASRASLNTLTNVVHGPDAIIETNASYRALFNDQSPYPLEYLKTHMEQKKMLVLKEVGEDKEFSAMRIGEKIQVLQQTQTKLALLTLQSSNAEPARLAYHPVGLFAPLPTSTKDIANSDCVVSVAPSR